VQNSAKTMSHAIHPKRRNIGFSLFVSSSLLAATQKADHAPLRDTISHFASFSIGKQFRLGKLGSCPGTCQAKS
jgi:hypothetical protein